VFANTVTPVAAADLVPSVIKWLADAAAVLGIPYLNLSASGSTLSSTILATTDNGALYRYFLRFATDCISFHGTNHIQAGTTGERDELIAENASLKALLPAAAKFYITTMTPHTRFARTVTLTSSGTTATGTVSGGHNLTTGTSVAIAGASQANYNGTFTVTVTNSTVFTYTMAGTAVSPATGTITETPSYLTLTEAQQDLDVSSARFLDYNANYVRAIPGLSGSDGYVDFEDDSATSRTSMKWIAGGSGDGIHQSGIVSVAQAQRVAGQMTPTRRASGRGRHRLSLGLGLGI
jgi:hypothetical protein